MFRSSEVRLAGYLIKAIIVFWNLKQDNWTVQGRLSFGTSYKEFSAGRILSTSFRAFFKFFLYEVQSKRLLRLCGIRVTGTLL